MSTAIQDFVDELLMHFGSSSNPIAQGQVKVEYKAKAVERLVAEVSSNRKTWDEPVLFSVMKTLRLLCREAAGCEDLVEEEIISLLTELGNLESGDASQIGSRSSIEALKCLANLQTMLPEMRQLYASSDKINAVLPALRLPGHSLGSAFLCCRLLFFASATNRKLSEQLTEEGVLDVVAMHLEKALSGEWEENEWITNMAMINELIKTAFNLTLSTSPLSVSLFTSSKTIVELDSSDPSVQKYVRLLKAINSVCTAVPLGSPAMSAPHLHAVNSLMNFPVLDPAVWFPNGDHAVLAILLDIFEQSFGAACPEKSQDAPDEELFGSPVDQALIPICLLLKKLTIIPSARLMIKKRLMPNNIDRTKHLNEGPHLTAVLIRAMTNVVLSQTRDFLGDLLLACYEDNVERFVRYVGYANAAGYLFQKGFSTPESTKGKGLGAGAAEDEFPDNIDAMTGRIKEEKPDPWAGMTEEEKERETEKLFYLFDRLNKTGMVQMKRQGE
ncbi:hypothetical protein HDV03_000968 [Kappamyces sp. JEL0829]|nr:hypothetical protein HDV03_000968 [Kappamyces sp. JEL0829]